MLARHFKKVKYDYISIIVLVILISVVLGFQFKWNDFDINVSWQYCGGDDFSLLSNAKAMTQQGWNMEVDRMGTPYINENYDFTASSMHNVDLVVMKFFALFTNEAGAVANLTFFSIFYLCGIISYFVMRELKLRRWIAVGGSWVFSMCTYIFTRNMGHIVLACCYFIPLSMLLCMWVYTRDDYLVFKKGFFKNPRNWLTILFVLLIANNGIVYYPFFTCFMLVIAGVSKSFKERNYRYLLKSTFIIVGILFFMALALIPTIIYLIKNGSNNQAVIRSGLAESEMYSLRIMQMFIPVNSHGISIIQRIMDGYNNTAFYVNENYTSYLGLIGGTGFLLLLATIFVRTKNEFWNKMRALSQLNLGLLLLGVAGGFNTVFSYFITDNIRGYCRISVFIFYAGVLCICFIVNEIYSKYQWKALIPIFLVLSGVSVWDQIPQDYADDVKEYRQEFYSDRDFVESIENQVPVKSMIYQLPYHKYPEGGPQNDMWDYHLYIGYIHSDTLKWSYGTMKGSVGDAWNEEVGTSDTVDMVAKLKEIGFAGIYIDRRAYTKDELEKLEDELSSITGQTEMVSRNNNLGFFRF